MNVLVAFASKHGATAEIAEAIAGRLRASGLSVDCREAGDVTSIEPYDAVVLGSAVYAGRWLPEARAFAERHADELAERPTWLFSSGPIGDPPHPAEPPALDGLEKRVHARAHRVLGGRLRRSDLSLPERAVVRVVKAPVGDYRDWDAVAAFAEEIIRSG
jgi:menaquinone-dependent protoporphyrinogen oxidase